MSPKAVLLKTSLTPVNIVRPVNTAHPKTTVYSAKPKTYFSKQAQSTAKRPFYKQKALTRRSVHEAKRHYYTGRHYAVNTARSYSGQVNVVRVKGVNAVKSSAYWVWRPTKSNGASLAFKRHNYIDARGRSYGCSRHMTGNIAYLSDFKQFDGGSAFGCKITEKGIKRECSVARTPQQNGVAERRNRTLIKALQNVLKMTKPVLLVLKGSNTELLVSPRFTWVFFLTTKDETSEILKNFIKEIENLVDKEKGIKREYSVARTPQQNGVAERRNRTLIEAARTMLADSKLPATFWAEVVSTACYVQNRVLVVKPHNKTPYELFRGFKPALSFMRPFGCHVTILNTLDNLGKFDGKSDEENKSMLEGNGPKWLFDIDSLTQSMNYVPVAAGTISNESIGTQGELNADKSEDDSSPKEVNTAGQHVNTVSPEVNTSRFKLNIVDPSVNTASSYDPDSPKDMFKLGASHTLEDTHVEFFSDEDEPEVGLGNDCC
ncbi:putative ribonuclease H-like domain-containing protein [Tanacetum coccineum]